ncbi:MAG: hypothetical protein MJ204_08710 [Bacteroidales bacterium]|nr:hypothetical protein [Bacteroidales bacterium]
MECVSIFIAGFSLSISVIGFFIYNIKFPSIKIIQKSPNEIIVINCGELSANLLQLETDNSIFLYDNSSYKSLCKKELKSNEVWRIKIRTNDENSLTFRLQWYDSVKIFPSKHTKRKRLKLNKNVESFKFFRLVD